MYVYRSSTSQITLALSPDREMPQSILTPRFTAGYGGRSLPTLRNVGRLEVTQCRPCGLAAGIAPDHAAALLPAALALDFVGGRAVLGHAAGRRAMPTRPLWPLKNSQSARPAALAITFTRRAICDSDSPNTFTLPPTSAGRMASSARMAAGVMATTALWASASVLERIAVMRPLP